MRDRIELRITTGVRIVSALVLISSCLVFHGCKAGKDQKVIKWVHSMPQSGEDAQKRGLPYYSSDEQWAAAGRKDRGELRKILLRLIKKNISKSCSGGRLPMRWGDVGSAESVPVLIRLANDKTEPIDV